MMKPFVKTNDGIIMDKPYRTSKRKIMLQSVPPNILDSKTKNTKQCY